ncbi:MAG: bifunctional 5,10-methylenetetrahydrofolate dehydrogenase/5,10-methenyltetrahydrofolate cyclohydrolase [Candidatus Omnitrophota bacterium]
MSAKLLEGKVLAAGIKESIKKEIESFKRRPKLVALQIGENAASAVYIKSQKRRAEEVGIEYELRTLPAGSTQGECESEIQKINDDASVNAIILQLPVPQGIDHRKLIVAIDPVKDAEGMHPENLGQVVLGQWRIAPCTASACLALIESAGEKLYGKEAVIVGHSEIVGKPISLMLLSKFATVSVCHIATGERGLIPDHVKRAEVLVVAVGKAGLIKGEWVKEGAIVIDVGINRIEGKIVGDIEFEAASRKASYITPVPGGVGPLTAAMLMKNTLEAYKMQLR